jgi:hypothetical protein
MKVDGFKPSSLFDPQPLPGGELHPGNQRGCPTSLIQVGAIDRNRPHTRIGKRAVR